MILHSYFILPGEELKGPNWYGDDTLQLPLTLPSGEVGIADCVLCTTG